MKLKKKINIKDYSLAKKEISKIAKDYNFFSLYEYGSYNNPGLSDIDLFLIINKKKKQEIKKFIKDIKNNTRLKFFFDHSTIMIVQPNFIKNIILFDDLKLQRFFGTKLKVIRYKKLEKLLLILSILEWLPERTLRLKENIDKFKHINLRQHLGLLNSLKYTYLKLSKFIEKKEILKFCKIIDTMRSDKKILKKKSKIFLFSKILLSFSNYLIYDFSNNPNIKILKTNINGEFTIKFPNNYRIFYSNNKLHKKKNKGIRVPLIYSLPFGYYVKKKDTLSRLLKNHVYISKNFDIETEEKDVKFIFKKRNKLLNENIKFLIENKISLGLYKFGWFLKK
jgi:hypothetical protein